MTLPASGPISFSDINTELALGATTPISLNNTDVRAMAGKPSGAISISDLYGKAWLTQSQVMAWAQTNRASLFLWTNGGSGDTRYVNNPYSIGNPVSKTYTYALSSASLGPSIWTTIILTANGRSPSFTSYSVNGGAIAIHSTAVTYNVTLGANGQMQQVVLYVNADFHTITSVYAQWSAPAANYGSWGSCLIMPGKWTGYTAGATGTSKTIDTNTFMVGSGYYGSYDGAYNPLGATPSGAAAMMFDGYWYSNGSLFFVSNSSGSSVTQTLYTDVQTPYATRYTTMSIG